MKLENINKCMTFVGYVTCLIIIIWIYTTMYNYHDISYEYISDESENNEKQRDESKEY